MSTTLPAKGSLILIAEYLTADELLELEAWQRAKGLAMSIDEPLTGGKTGAAVLRVVLHDDSGPDRKIVVKIIPRDEDLAEPRRHSRALDLASPNFATAHMVRQVLEPFGLSTGSTLMFQGLAGGSLQQYSSVEALSGTSDFPKAAKEILSTLAQEWMAAPDAMNLTPGEILRQQIRTKMDDDGSLKTWLEREFGPEILHATTLKFSEDESGLALVNPVQLLRPESPWNATPQRFLVGKSHGDLHAGNAIVKLGGRPDFSDFRLIDFSYYEESVSLAIDPVTLVFSEIQAALGRLPFADLRVLLLRLTTDRDEWLATSTEVQHLLDIEQDARAVGQAHADELGFGDEWRNQWTLALCAAGLVWASRPRLTFQQRTWFFELASRAATSFARMSGGEIASDAPALIGEPYDARRGLALAAIDELARENANFSRSVTSIALIPESTSLSLAAQGAIVAAGWAMVIGFDPSANTGGPVSLASSAGAAVRVLIASQDYESSSAFTTWLAADGLQSAGYRADKPLMEWRFENLKGISNILDSLGRSSIGPVVVTVFGPIGKKSGLILDRIIDSVGPLTRVVAVDSAKPSSVAEYASTEIVGDTEIIASLLPPAATKSANDKGRMFLPAGDGQPAIELAWEDKLWMEQGGGEVLHSGVALESRAVDGLGIDFYRGRKVSWLELDSGTDVPRSDALERLKLDMDRLLAERGTYRHSFRHRAGAGGTTLARRLAWDLHEQYPVLLFSKVLDADEVVRRVQKLSSLTGNRVLLIVDGVPESITTMVFEKLKTDSTPSVVLSVGRRASSASTSAEGLGTLSPDESEKFRRVFTNQSSLRRNDLTKLRASGIENQVPFLYALTAFQSDFHGVADYVGKSLIDSEPGPRSMIASVAVVHRFAGESVAASTFATLLNLPKNEVVRLRDFISQRASGLLVEERPGEWRTVHVVVASELIKQLIGRESPAQTSVFGSLASWAEEFIETVSIAYPVTLPESVHQLLLKLFILRDNRDESALGSRQRFSELIEEIPRAERFQVMRTLAECFPEDPHFWAHYARLLAYDGKDYVSAYEKIDTALALAPDDPTIWHIRGVVGRKKVLDLIDEHRPNAQSPADFEKTVLAATEIALSDLAKASDLNDASRYPQVDIVYLCISVIEWAKDFKKVTSHQELLASREGEPYLRLLYSAENALDDLEDLEADEQSDHTDELRTKLRIVYDDFSGLIKGWQKLLSQPGADKMLMRSRLARAYVQQAGSYSDLDSKSLESVVTLMEENIRDNPRHVRSIREWLRVARRAGRGLDKANGFVSFWVEEDASRDARFYDYVISALLVFQGRGSARADYERKVEWSKARSQGFSRRRAVYEWLGKGKDLSSLVHHKEVEHWDRRREGSVEPAQLRRVNGVIHHLKNSKSGSILLEDGLKIFFAPGNRYVRGRDENLPVSALIGFTYDGPEAWRVVPL